MTPSEINSPTWLPSPSSASLKKNEVALWRIALSDVAIDMASFQSRLSKTEWARAVKMGSQKNLAHYLVAHAALQEIVSLYLNEAGPHEWSINSHGKPYLKNSALHFNLSHSGDWAVIALALNREVGADIEKVRPNIRTDDLAQRFFSEVEAGTIVAFEKQAKTEAFFNCWSRKEAYVKARGLGLSLTLKSFVVPLEADCPCILKEDDNKNLTWKILDVACDASHKTAVSARGSDWFVSLWEKTSEFPKKILPNQ